LAFPGDKGKIHGPDDVAWARLRLDRGAQTAISTPIATRRYRFDRIRCSKKVAYTSYSLRLTPLTALELWLRQRGGLAPYSGSFIEHLLQEFLY
jgi:hypothetical protein